jgi:hypothetical protein
MTRERRFTLRQGADGRWRVADARPAIQGATRDRCIERLRQAHPKTPLLIEAIPAVVGVAEAAAILGWDKRRVATYVARGSFPAPLATLAGGRVWALDDVRSFAEEMRTRRRASPR